MRPDLACPPVRIKPAATRPAVQQYRKFGRRRQDPVGAQVVGPVRAREIAEAVTYRAEPPTGLSASRSDSGYGFIEGPQ